MDRNNNDSHDGMPAGIDHQGQRDSNVGDVSK
jgi:hypothetical protein